MYGWASGEDSSTEANATGQKPERHFPVSCRRRMRGWNISHRLRQRHLSSLKHYLRKKRKLAWKRTGWKSLLRNCGAISRNTGASGVTDKASSQNSSFELHVQDKQIVVRTLDNMSLIWNRQQPPGNDEFRRALPKEISAPNPGTSNSARLDGNSEEVQSQMSSSQVELPSLRKGRIGSSDDVVMLSGTNHIDEQGISRSCSPRINAHKPGNISIGTNTEESSITFQDASDDTGVNCTLFPQTARSSSSTVPEIHCQSDSPLIKRITYQTSDSLSKNCSISSRPTPGGYNLPQAMKRPFSTPLSHQSKAIMKRTPLRPPRGRGRRQTNLSSRVSASVTGVHCNQPIISNVVGGQEALTMTNPCFRSSPSRQNLTDKGFQGAVYAGDGVGQVLPSNQKQVNLPKTMSQDCRVSSGNQLGPAARLQESYQGHQHPSQMMATHPTRGATLVSSLSDHPVLSTADIGSVYWTCGTDKPVDIPVAMPKIENPFTDVPNDVPVAAEMKPLTSEDMVCNGVNISNQKLRLARGFDVFITRYVLLKIENTSKNSWSILTRRLLDNYFDQATLAMGRASDWRIKSDTVHHKPLDQNVIGAIRADEEGSDEDSDDQEELSLQQLAAAELEDEEDDGDEWQPKKGKNKRKKKQNKRKDFKRRHLEEVVLVSPRKAKELAVLADEEGSDEDSDDQEEPSLQKLAAAELEDEEEDDGGDEWQPMKGKNKRKDIKQNEKDSKRRHLEEVFVSPRKAKELATLALNKSVENGSDEEEEKEQNDADYRPGTRRYDSDSDSDGDSNDDSIDWDAEDDTGSDDGDSEMEVGEIDEEAGHESEQDEDEEYTEEDGDYEGLALGNVDLKDGEDFMRLLRSKQDVKKRPKGQAVTEDKGQRVLRVREARSTKESSLKSSKKVASDENKENIGSPQKQLRSQSTPKSEKPPQSETLSAKTVADKTPAAKAKTNEKGEDSKMPDGRSRAGTKEHQTPQVQKKSYQTPNREGGIKGKTPKTTPALTRTPADSPKTRSGKIGVAKQDGGEDDTKTPNRGARSLPNQTPKSSKKDSGKSQQAKTPKKVKLQSGTVIEDLAVGNGKMAKAGKMVYVYYRGILAKNNKEFDSCTEGKPFNFRLGKLEVIKGWDEGIAGMKVGGKRRLTVPASQGYKNKKVGPVPPNSTLIFTVELKAVN